MSDAPNYWLNVDIVTKTATLHALGCTHEIDKRDTEYKGIGRLKRDGGWLGFTTRDDADRHARANLQGYKVKTCGLCF